MKFLKTTYVLIRVYTLLNNNGAFSAAVYFFSTRNLTSPSFARLETSLSRETFKNCRESMNTKSPTGKEMYFSELLGIQVIGFLLIFPTSV